MPRLTITLSTERHRALKEAAARRGRTIGQLIEESLDLAGIKTVAAARDIVAKARSHARLSDERATALALGETRAVRRRR